jgi:FMN-dependent NADH-azoreductase
MTNTSWRHTVSMIEAHRFGYLKPLENWKSKSMAHILHIDSSARGDRSNSRNLTHNFMTAWQSAHPSDTVTYRDLGHYPVAHFSEVLILALYSPIEQHSPEMTEAIAASNQIVNEFLAADRYVFSIPMYNLNVPSTFKAYIDQIVIAGKTFKVSEKGYEPLVHGKKMLVITSRGADYSAGSPFAAYDFQEPYLRAIFGFIGITDITFVNANGMDMGEEKRAQAEAASENALQEAVLNW